MLCASLCLFPQGGKAAGQLWQSHGKPALERGLSLAKVGGVGGRPFCGLFAAKRCVPSATSSSEAQMRRLVCGTYLQRRRRARS